MKLKERQRERWKSEKKSFANIADVKHFSSNFSHFSLLQKISLKLFPKQIFLHFGKRSFYKVIFHFFVQNPKHTFQTFFFEKISLRSFPLEEDVSQAFLTVPSTPVFLSLSVEFQVLLLSLFLSTFNSTNGEGFSFAPKSFK